MKLIFAGFLSVLLMLSTSAYAKVWVNIGMGGFIAPPPPPTVVYYSDPYPPPPVYPYYYPAAPCYPYYYRTVEYYPSYAIGYPYEGRRWGCHHHRHRCNSGCR